jgi:acetyl-CoA carboxylase biotin carboxylase subunit
VQRRHQKVIEEAPSAVVDADLRRRMGEAAARLALAAGYTNAGTVEFLVDGDDKSNTGEQKNFYFLEMNTRLQVEHPVTELVTGLDLVHLQLLVAQGGVLPIRQEQVVLRGHAIECRVYAEDPENGFMPSPGRITRLIQPGGPGVREDCGVYEGWTVPLDYDPMLSKLIAFGETREAAIDRMQSALREYFIGGVASNLGLFRRILGDEDFRAARIDTGYLDRLLAGEQSLPAADEGTEDAAAIAAALFELLMPQMAAKAGAVAEPQGAWQQAARREALRG